MNENEAYQLVRNQDALEYCKKQSMLEQMVGNEKWRHYEYAAKALEKQIPQKPFFWEEKYYYSPTPNDDWGYECPCCGNRDIDYPEHHCICGQALDWSEIE